jgi:hypothetical protein
MYKWKAVLYERQSENIESASQYAKISSYENKGKQCMTAIEYEHDGAFRTQRHSS